MQEDKATRH